MVVEGIGAVIVGVSPRVVVVVVRNSPSEQFLMESLVDGIEEIVISAVEDYVRVSRCQTVELVDDGVGVPHIGIFFIGSELFFHFPVVGEGANVYSAADATSGAENVGVAHREPQPAVAAHAESRDGTSASVGPGGVVRVDVAGEFVRDECLELRLGLGGAVPVPTAFAIGTNKDEAVACGNIVERGFDGNPGVLVAAEPVQEVDGGIGGLRVIIVGKDDDAGNRAAHFVAGDLVFYHFGLGLEGDECEKECEQLFHGGGVEFFC